jgi:tyrosine aminotransferase
MTIGPTVCVQAAVPKLLSSTPRGWHDDVCAAYRTASNACCLGAASSPGLTVEARPQGAMYLLVRVALDAFDGPLAANDAAWCAALQAEEQIMLLPGSAFGAPGCVRVVLCAPEAVLETAWHRIEAFCKRHVRKEARAPASPVLLWDSNLVTGMM